MHPFKTEVNKAMMLLAEHPQAVFVGQSVQYDGAAIYESLRGVPAKLRWEVPVLEDFQLGYCIGLALTGKLPICIYPRMDFMLLALNQLVNHLDKMPLWGWKPKVILRTRVGSKAPLNAGPQHTQDHTQAFIRMLTTIPVWWVREPHEVPLAYRAALDAPTSILIVEAPPEGY